MIIVDPSIELYELIDGNSILTKLEACGRVSYESEDLITVDSAYKFVRDRIRSKHLTILEHHSITVKITCARIIADELLRHRLASPTVSSTRFVNFMKDRYGGQIKVVVPFGFEKYTPPYNSWLRAVTVAEEEYKNQIKMGVKPEMARDSLSFCLQSRMYLTANLREWRHILSLRTARDAHPALRELMNKLLNIFRTNIPVVFDDLEVKPEH